MVSTLSLQLYHTGFAFSRLIQSSPFSLSTFPFHKWIKQRYLLHWFLQCVRRLFEERDSVHGYNGLRYFTTIVAVIIRTAFEFRKKIAWKVLALLSSAVAAIANTYWDIVVDWGLLQKRSKNLFLRDKLIVPHKNVYFVAMVMYKLARIRTSFSTFLIPYDSPLSDSITGFGYFSQICLATTCLDSRCAFTTWEDGINSIFVPRNSSARVVELLQVNLAFPYTRYTSYVINLRG